MADIPDNKQKRLMSLNQDVLAVSPAQQATTREKAPARPAAPSARAMITDTPDDKRPAALLLVLAALALIGLGTAVASMLFAMKLQQRVDQLNASAVEPDALAQRLAQRVEDLESRLDAAGQETGKMDDEAQSSLLQFSSRLRKVALDVTRLNGDLDKLRSSLDTNAKADTRTEKLISEQAAGLAALEKAVAALKAAPAKAPAPAASSGSSADLEQQLIQLNIKVERQASEIRTIYRMLEAQ